MPPRDDRWMLSFGLVLTLALITIFVALGALLTLRVESAGPSARRHLAVAQAAVAVADLGWRVWGR